MSRTLRVCSSMHRGRYTGAENIDLDADTPAKNPTITDRRALLLGAIFLVGGGAALVHFARDRKQREVDAGAELSTARFSLLEQVTETIIPTTDTPGAIGAGVPAFLRSLLADWASARTREEMIGVLDAIERRSWATFGAGFIELSPDRRATVLKEIDAESMSKAAGGWRRFKHLVLLGYYQSEIGATQELRFELVPGAWRSCLPLDEVGRASAV
jgi:gluconate 2-dehydrogenase gamma chain